VESVLGRAHGRTECPRSGQQRTPPRCSNLPVLN
jgi:hypothetical protein